MSLGGDDPGRAEPIPSVMPEAGPTTEILNRMWRSTTALLDTASARTLLDTPAGRTVLSRFANDGVETDDHDDFTESSVPRLGSFEVMMRTIDIAQAALMRHTLSAYPPDLLNRGAAHRSPAVWSSTAQRRSSRSVRSSQPPRWMRWSRQSPS